MTAAAEALHPRPARRAVAGETFRAVGECVRMEVLAALALMAGLLVMMLLGDGSSTSGADYDVTDMTWPVVVLGLAAPMSVWKGEEPSRRGYLWSMPVDRFRHTMMKVASGWVWLMGLVAVYVLWAMSVAVVTGGHIVVSPEFEKEMLRGLPPGTLIRDLTLSGHAWLWLVPFGAATMTYLFGTILALLTEYPMRVFAGAALLFVMLVGLAESSGGATERFAEAMLGQAIAGAWGFFTQVSGILHVYGERGPDMGGPNLRAWAGASLVWVGTGLVGVVLAARRYQER